MTNVVDFRAVDNLKMTDLKLDCHQKVGCINSINYYQNQSYLKSTTPTSKISNIIECHSNNTSALDMSH